MASGLASALQGVGIKQLSMAQLDVLEELHHAALSAIAARRMDLVGCWCRSACFRTSRTPTLPKTPHHLSVHPNAGRCVAGLVPQHARTSGHPQS